ncbi:unnamed protein product [Clonostachys byssicola]|uniref:Xylanolytic transcriptional activator regulatory domain-containing protein n=1 Tax=Clonostachys byssicola TaxID=160290 RepID=A0A9N9UMX3_9HYPO|nr:unnamed protein product [Clonostachys byssicola]
MSQHNALNNHSRSIPPTEIGSFVALGACRSEFIGSASGVFFANTVFKAFSDLPTSREVGGSKDLPNKLPAPEPAHTYLAGSETESSQQDVTHSGQVTQSSGFSALGMLPTPRMSKELTMAYFRHWHPVFPFLHGPTFLEEVNKAYGGVEGESVSFLSKGPRPQEDLCRMVTVQCVFGIAATTPGLQLDQACRIQSTQGLLQLLGSLYNSPDILSLQALLAAELYMITIMSLRAASTVHGALTRMMYHAGIHRCPFRYLQLPEPVRGIRKRIFWCAYIFDRHLGQALGHPLSFNDIDVDVCVPGMPELHRPVPVNQPADTPGDDSPELVLAHLPQNQRQEREHLTGLAVESSFGGSPTEPGVRDSSEGQPTLGGEKQETILGLIATHAQLLGTILNLFHNSIHTRSVDLDSVQEITCRVHSWWNRLPLSIQDSSPGETNDLTSRYHVFFTTLYNHSLLLLNRPFLSLPRERFEFKCSLQAAINASHSLLMDVNQHLENGLFLSWPTSLSAVWTAGLVVSFATLLDQYPFSKSKCELEWCHAILDRMAKKWSSARQCHAALNLLSRKLITKYETPNMLHSQSYPLPRSPRIHSHVTPSRRRDPSVSSTPRVSKRQRVEEPGEPARSLPQQDAQWAASIYTTESTFQISPNSLAVPQYIGPDFGFDTSLPDEFGEGQDLMNEILNLDYSTLFSGSI